MIHPKIKILIIILFIVVACIYVIFFTKNDEQLSGAYAEKIKNELKVIKNPEEAIYRDFNLGEYYTKIGDFKNAKIHYTNVYRNYPEVAKSYLKWRALQNLKQIERIEKQLADETSNKSDTEVILKEYFKKNK